MSQITTGSTIICGENQAANRIFPVQFDPGAGGLQSLTVIHKENLRAYEIEVGNCKGTKNYPTSIDWIGTNADGSPVQTGQQQITPNSIEITPDQSNFNGAIEIRFQDNSKEVNLISIEQSSPGVFVDPRLTLTSP